MKQKDYEEVSDDDHTVGMADFRDSPFAVLEAVDVLLAAHGLEIEMIDTQADHYHWRIVQAHDREAIKP